MRMFPKFRLIFLMIVMSGPVLLHPVVAAQDTGLISDTEYLLTYGATLTWDDPWVVDEEASGFTRDQMGDYVAFQAATTAYMQYATLPAIGDLPSFIGNIAANVAGADGEILETDSDKVNGYAYVEAEQGSTPIAFAIFAFRTADLATEQAVILIVEPGTVGTWIESVQETFELDGEPLLAEVDADEAQAAFGEADTTTADTDATDDKKLPDDGAGDEEDANGLTGDRSYISPQFDTVVEWNQRWIADEALATSDADEGVDYLALDRRGGDAALYLSLRDSAELSPEEWMTSFTGDIATGNDLEILDSDASRDGAWALYQREVEGAEVTGYIEAYVGDGDVLIIVEVAGPNVQREFERVFDAAQASVTIDGAAPFTLANEVPDIP